ncbi:hypothetical protein GQ53DRAFT_318969 [Thozetella sp. PMI_491]|nr:hypothetical protein GQ53DRAFT_318969 [Thozetella sp. PMI_491]
MTVPAVGGDQDTNSTAVLAAQDIPAAMEEHDVTAALFDSLGDAEMAPDDDDGAAEGVPESAFSGPENDAMATIGGEVPIDWDEMEATGPGVSIHADELEGMFMALDEEGKEVDEAAENHTASRPGSRAAAPDLNIGEDAPESSSQDGEAIANKAESCAGETAPETSTAPTAFGDAAPEEQLSSQEDTKPRTPREETNKGVPRAEAGADGVPAVDEEEEDDVTAALFDSLKGEGHTQTEARITQQPVVTDEAKSDLPKAAESPPVIPSNGPPAVEENLQPETEEAHADKEDPRLCVVCKKEPGKYKCTLCSAPFCSVACNRIHKENHPPVPERTALPTSTPKPKRKWEDDDPYGVLLEHLDEFQRLFRKYPNLENELNQIGKATLPPPNGHLPPRHKNQHGFHKKNRPWTKEDGLRKGAAALRKARTDPSEKGDAVREYCELVLHLLSKPGDSKATRLVREAVVAGDTKAIEQLMQDEKDKD